MKKISFLLFILLLLTSVITVGCGDTFSYPTPHFIPKEYIECVQVDPQNLINLYFLGFPDFVNVEGMYNDIVYILKDIPVDARMLLGIDEGYIWVDQIKCYLVNPDVMDKFKIGDKIDVIGLNTGPTSYFIPGLTFKNCIVLPAGEVALPLDGGLSSFTPAY